MSAGSHHAGPLADLALTSGQVHLWRASLEQPPALLRRLWPILSSGEQIRAERFHRERDTDRYVVAHGALRQILSLYTGVEPSQLLFRFGEQGKPHLAAGVGDGALRFNLAHAHEIALYAIARGREVGIDVEHVHDLPDATQIAARFFSTREHAELLALPESQRVEAFFNCWTRKEAYVKALGGGLSLPLDQFDVSLIPGEPACLLSARGDRQEVSQWCLRELSPAPGYVGALAVEGHDWQLIRWQWPQDLPSLGPLL